MNHAGTGIAAGMGLLLKPWGFKTPGLLPFSSYGSTLSSPFNSPHRLSFPKAHPSNISPQIISPSRKQSPDNLEQLADLLAAAKEATIFDLGGKTLSGPLKKLSMLENRLVMAAPGLTIRDGVLQLPDNAQLIIRGVGACLEELTVRGQGKPGAGLVWVDGAQDFVLRSCTMEKLGGSNETLVIDNGANGQCLVQ